MTDLSASSGVVRVRPPNGAKLVGSTDCSRKNNKLLFSAGMALAVGV